jgi:uncharacterized repeat protein (TIGR01451 family)
MNATHRTVVSGLIVTAMVLLVLVPATTATADADLSVTLDVSPTSGLGPGGNVTYTATVSNGGPDAATSVSLVVTLPSGVIPISVTPDGPCAFNAAGTAVNCALGTIANGAASAATIVVHPITVGMKTATANATAAEADPNPGDNTHTASSTLTEVGISDVAVTLADSPDPNKVGRVLFYVATVTNIQDDSAANVVVSVPLPSTVFFLAAASERGACAVVGRTVNCPIGGLNPSVSVKAVIAVLPLAPGWIYATAGVALTTPDPNTTNNSATARTWVNP